MPFDSTTRIVIELIFIFLSMIPLKLFESFFIKFFYLCLFATQGYDLKPLVRSATDPKALTQAIAAIWAQRDDRYSELRVSEPMMGNDAAPSSTKRKVEMSYIGG
jgi:molybdenum cofactor biosynthesis enzyme MoaA